MIVYAALKRENEMKDLKSKVVALATVGAISVFSSFLGASISNGLTNRKDKMEEKGKNETERITSEYESCEQADSEEVIELHIKELDRYYILTIVDDLDKENHFYLCTRSIIYSETLYFLPDNFMLIAKEKYNRFSSEYGTIKHVTKFANILFKYKDLKESYSSQEVEEAFEAFKNDYSSFHLEEIEEKSTASINNTYSNSILLDSGYSNNKTLIMKQ